ncbi:dual specificity protein phosphatase CDC14B-like [Aphis craccivora]|uniref:Dual specificity protein phosphatase CDC14B-like n=1 Tax=Aphis craccivora TaxID=307492 RepID=A0A6G0ZE34_APHCR|nr:dual specificity protein phosphatase CDC14B-like [Aphis craccivora]
MVPNRSADTLIPIIETTLLPILLSYQIAGRHMQANHKYNFVDPDTGAHTQNIERLWRSTKERNKKHSGIHRRGDLKLRHGAEWYGKRKVSSTYIVIIISSAIVVLFMAGQFTL